MSCNSSGCQAIQRFVDELMTNRNDISYSVVEGPDDLSVAVHFQLPDKPKTLQLPLGQEGLNEAMKHAISTWVAENVPRK
jgi:hypothetical protein